MITLCKEETGVLVMTLSEHLWPEDLESAIPVVYDVARSRRNPLLLLVDVLSSFDTSPLTFSVKFCNREFWRKIVHPELQC